MSKYQYATNQPDFMAQQYIKSLWNTRFIISGYIVLSIIFTKFLILVIPENVKNDFSFLANFLSFGSWEMKAIHFCQGLYVFVVISYRYSTVIDIVSIIVQIMFQFFGPQWIPQILTAALPQQSCVECEQLIRWKLQYTSCKGLYLTSGLYQSAITTIFIAFILVLVIEIRSRLKFQLKPKEILIPILVIMQLYDVIVTAQSIFGRSFDESTQYYDKKRLLSPSLLAGAISGALVFEFEHIPGKIGQKLINRPENTAIGFVFSSIARSQPVSWSLKTGCILIMVLMCIFVNSHNSGNPLAVLTQYMLSRYLFMASTVVLLMISMFAPAGHKAAGGPAAVTVVGVASFVVRLNRFILQGIEFGPYSLVILALVMAGVVLEVAAVVAVIEVGFGRIITKAQIGIEALSVRLTKSVRVVQRRQ